MAESEKRSKDSSQEERALKESKGARAATSATGGPAAGGELSAGGGGAPAGTGAEARTTPPRAPRGGKLKERAPEAERSVDLPPESPASAQEAERTTGTGETPSGEKKRQQEQL